MASWTVAIIIEFEANSGQEAEAFVDDICNESSADFIWLDTITDNASKRMIPSLGEDL